ncbi:MAG: restriction endonuclease subunit S, partial [Candidatus Sedimenticola sp. (ex Thyasira tokunagai)]
GYKQTELGEIPGDWSVVKLGNVLERIIGGGTPGRSNPAYWGDEIPWVTVKDFATFDPELSQEYITKIGLQNSSSNLVPEGTLITSTRMALGKAVIYDVPVAINQDLKALFPKKIVSTKFLYYWFEDNAEIIDEMGSGSTVKGLSLSDLKSIEFRLPSIEEQTAITKVLDGMDKDIGSLERRLTKTQQLKQGMMQELLTGKTRLV